MFTVFLLYNNVELLFTEDFYLFIEDIFKHAEEAKPFLMTCSPYVQVKKFKIGTCGAQGNMVLRTEVRVLLCQESISVIQS